VEHGAGEDRDGLHDLELNTDRRGTCRAVLRRHGGGELVRADGDDERARSVTRRRSRTSRAETARAWTTAGMQRHCRQAHARELGAGTGSYARTELAAARVRGCLGVEQGRWRAVRRAEGELRCESGGGCLGGMGLG
jgi:hypothetical protein